MSIEWRERKRSGKSVVGKSGTDLEGTIIISDLPPEWVKLPPELGGLPCEVVRHFTAPCPVTGFICRHLVLDCGIYVAESTQFFWYRPTERQLEREQRGQELPEPSGGLEA
jgi:hypothetical protein